MADSETTHASGYPCEFVGPVSDDLVCRLCKCVAREPHLTSCCGETFCRKCIHRFFADVHPCPACQAPEFKPWFNVKYQRKISALEVRCTMQNRGCTWRGNLAGLAAHLDLNTAGDCQYVDVQCTECGKQVQKRNVASHLAESCPKREVSCEFCGFTAACDNICNVHWPQCGSYPVPCPNACEIQDVKRGDLDAHLSVCPLGEVKCDFENAGCSMKLQRQDLESHMADNIQQHLVLLSNMNQRTCREFTQKLQKQEEEFQLQLKKCLDDRLQEQEVQLLEQEERLRAEFRMQLKRRGKEFRSKLLKKKKRLQALEKETQQVKTNLQKCRERITCIEMQTCFQPPFYFTMTNYSAEREREKIPGVPLWVSPPMYTHSSGYKFQIEVIANGYLPSIEKHVVVVQLLTLRGEFDDQLNWPASCTITLQLLNQHADRDHITVTETFQWYKPTAEHANKLAFASDKIACHDDLPWKLGKRTQYLKHNCLCFRIAKVKVNY